MQTRDWMQIRLEFIMITMCLSCSLFTVGLNTASLLFSGLLDSDMSVLQACRYCSEPSPLPFPAPSISILAAIPLTTGDVPLRNMFQ